MAVLITLLVVVALSLFVLAGTVSATIAGQLARAGHVTPGTATVISATITASLRLLSAPLWACMMLAIWHDLRMRAEGADLLAKIAALPPQA